jgi:hypothetical protein
MPFAEMLATAVPNVKDDHRFALDGEKYPVSM